jgi:hypothetical protein
MDTMEGKMDFQAVMNRILVSTKKSIEEIRAKLESDFQKIIPQQTIEEVEAQIEKIKKTINKGNMEPLLQQYFSSTDYENLIKAKTAVEEIKKAMNGGNWEGLLEKYLPTSTYENLIKAKTAVEEIKKAMNGGNWGPVLEKYMPSLSGNLTNFKNQFEKVKSDFSDYQKLLKDGNWQQIMVKAFPDLSIDKILDVNIIIQKIRNSIKSIQAIFPSSGLQEALHSILPENIFEKLFDINNIGGKIGNIIHSASGVFSNIFSGVLSFFGFKAGGGPVYTGSPYVVGEKGPELFVPNTSGTIIPNHQLGITTGTTTLAPQVTVNVINNSGQAVSARQESSFDGQSYVVDVWLDALNRNVGGLRDVVMAGR